MPTDKVVTSPSSSRRFKSLKLEPGILIALALLVILIGLFVAGLVLTDKKKAGNKEPAKPVASSNGAQNLEIQAKLIDESKGTKDKAQAYFIQGNIYIDEKDTASAIVSLQKAVELDPTHVGAASTLGRIYFDQKDKDNAIRYLNAALVAIKINPKDPLASKKAFFEQMIAQANKNEFVVPLAQ